MKPILRTALFSLAFFASGAAKAELKIAVSAPISGAAAGLGQQVLKGVQAAVDDINQTGSVNGEKLIVIPGDDRSDARQGLDLARKFANDGIKFVIGPANSSVAVQTSDAYRDAHILMITPSAISPKLTERGLWNVFRTCGREDQQGSLWARTILSTLSGKTVAIAQDNSSYGKSLTEAARAELAAAGLKPVLDETVSPGEKDYSALVAKIKRASADILLWGGFAPEAALLVRQMRDAGLTTLLIGGDSLAGEDFVAAAGANAEGTLASFPLPASNRPEAKDIADSLEARKIPSEGYTLYAYASVQIIAQTATSIKSNDPVKIAAELHAGRPVRTAIGALAFDAKGDLVTPDYVLHVWKKSGDKIALVPMAP